jgi:hypothetical protein
MKLKKGLMALKICLSEIKNWAGEIEKGPGGVGNFAW